MSSYFEANPTKDITTDLIFAFEYEDPEEFEDCHNVDPDTLDPWKVARAVNIGVSSQKEFYAGHLVDGILVSALFVDPVFTSCFSFDVVVLPDYQAKGLGTELVDEAIEVFDLYLEQMSEGSFFKEGDFKYCVEVVNPHMKSLLERKGFYVYDTFADGKEWLMRRSRENPMQSFNHDPVYGDYDTRPYLHNPILGGTTFYHVSKGEGCKFDKAMLSFFGLTKGYVQRFFGIHPSQAHTDWAEDDSQPDKLTVCEVRFKNLEWAYIFDVARYIDSLDTTEPDGRYPVRLTDEGKEIADLTKFSIEGYSYDNFLGYRLNTGRHLIADLNRLGYGPFYGFLEDEDIYKQPPCDEDDYECLNDLYVTDEGATSSKSPLALALDFRLGRNIIVEVVRYDVVDKKGSVLYSENFEGGSPIEFHPGRENPMTTVPNFEEYLKWKMAVEELSDWEVYEYAKEYYPDSLTNPDKFLEEHPESVGYRYLHGLFFTFVGPKGRLLKVYAEDIEPIEGNIFDDFKLRGLAVAPEFTDFKIPLFVGYVQPWLMSQGRYEETVEYEDAFYEPDEDDIGEVFFQLRDGNHRTIATLLSGEPYAYVQVAENAYQDYKEWVEAGRPDEWPGGTTVLKYLDENLI